MFFFTINCTNLRINQLNSSIITQLLQNDLTKSRRKLFNVAWLRMYKNYSIENIIKKNERVQ